ncbi:hypothetical protein Tco_1158128, partial [Tanacetum coccineum]
SDCRGFLANGTNINDMRNNDMAAKLEHFEHLAIPELLVVEAVDMQARADTSVRRLKPVEEISALIRNG